MRVTTKNERKLFCEALKKWEEDKLKEELINQLYFQDVYNRNPRLARLVNQELFGDDRLEREAQKVKK